MFGNNKISQPDLMGAAFQVSLSVSITPQEEGMEVTFQSEEDAKELLSSGLSRSPDKAVPAAQEKDNESAGQKRVLPCWHQAYGA